jgi:TP901 family phage tail tape measure protein
VANTRVNIDVNINTGDAARSLRQLQAQINSFQSALNTNNRLQGDASRYYSQQIKDLANQSGFFTAETVKMRTAASQLDQTLSKGQGTMRQFVSAKFLKDSAAAAQVLSLANSRASALQTQFVATGAAANGFREAVAIRPLQAFNSEAVVSTQKLAIHRAMLSQSTTSMINFGKNTQWAGRQLMVGFTVPLTIFAATSGKVFREIETEAINFRKVYGDAFTPPEEMEANLEAIKELAKEYTKYGIAVKDTIGLAAQAAAAGSQGADLIDATRESTRLATLGQMEQSQALETTIALQTAFGLQSKELTKTINFLNMVENQTVVTLQDLAQAIPRVAPVIKGLGGSVEDMAAMLAAMQEGGISAAQGANALKSGLASLINPTNRAVEKLGELGININAIVDANRGDLMGTVQGFARALATLDEFGKQQALEKVFGKYQYARLGALFNNIIKDGSQASRVMDTAALSAAQLAASATKELGAIEDSSATKFVAAMERLKLAIAPIGEMFVELATPVLGFLASLVDKFNSLPDFAKKFIGFGTVITGIIIPAGTMFLGLLMNLAGTLTKFGLVVGVAFKGFAQGGLKGSIEAVSQALNYMSLTELDAANASTQLGTSTGIVNQALRDQVPAAAGADAAIDSLSRSYAALIVQMAEAAQLSKVAFVAPGAAMSGAAATGAEAGRRRGGPRIRRNSGGTIPGSGNTDTVPAMLTPGEFVVNKQATAENLSLLHSINKGKKTLGFNKGGQIPGMQYFAATNPQRVVQQASRFWNADSAEFAGMFSTGSKKIIRSSDTPSETRRTVSVAFEDSANGRLTSKQLSQLLGKPERTIQEAATSLGIEQMKLPGISSQLVRAWKKEDVDGYLASLNLRAEKAHFGTKKATKSDIDAAIRLRGTGERAQFAKRLFDADIPVTALTDDWATFSSSLNQAANRGNTRISIEQAIDDILKNKNILELGPAITNAGVSKEQFLTSLIAELKNKNGKEIFTDTILTSARNDALRKLGKSVTPSTTGLRIPAKADLQEIVAPIVRKANPEDVTFDEINKHFLNKKGFEILSAKDTGTGYSAIKEKASGKFEKLAASTGYNNGGMIPMLGAGGIALAANAARGARGRIPANIVEWFSRMTTSINQSNRDDMLQNLPANIKRGLSTSRKKIDITRGSVDPISGRTLKDVSSWSTGQGVGRFMESSRLFDTMNNSKFQIAQRSQGMKRDIDWLRSLGPDGPHPLKTWSPFNQENGALGLRLTPEEIQASGGVIWKANKKKLEERIKRDQEFIAGHQKIIDDLQESNIPTIYKTSIKKGEKYFDVSGRIVPRDEQRINNPAASNEILDEKEVALLGARLTGRPKTRIVEREEAQARYDKAKEEIKKIRMSIFNKEMSVEKAKPLLDRLHDETENMAAFVNWGRGREVSYPNVVSNLSMGGILPQMRNIGGEIFDSTKTSKTIVPGVGNKDTVPAMLTPGEFVINKDSTRKNLDLLRSVNNGTIRGYADGDIVEVKSSSFPDRKEITRYMVEGFPDETYSTKREAEKVSKQIKKTKSPSKRMMGGRGMGASMGMGTLGGAMMMAPMIPAIGENATLSAIAGGGGMALSLASALPMLAPMLAPLAAIAVPAGIVAASLAVVGVALYAWRKTVDDAAVKAAEFGANIGGTANALNTMAQVLGTLTPAQARQKAVMGISSEEEATIANEFSGVFESGAGQKFIEDLQNSTSAERFQKLSDYLKTAIASGMMDQKAATTFAKAVGLKLGDSVLSNQAVSSISGQKAGTSAIKEIADMRKAAVDADGSLAKLAVSSGEASLSNEAAGRAIGAATQIIQDYGNVIGVAEQQYAEGTIGWNEYHTAITEARTAQEQYTNVIKKSVSNAAEQGAARQALDQQMVAAGYTEDQVGAITNSTNIGTSSLGFSESKDYLRPALSLLSGNLAGAALGMVDVITPSQSAYQKEFVKQQADVQFDKSFGELDSTQQTSLVEESKEAQDLAREVDLEGLNEAIKASVLAGDMTAEQAAQFGQEIMYNVDALKALRDGASIATAQFITFAQNIPGITKGQSSDVVTIGKEFEAAGGNTALIENYIASLPENLLKTGIETLKSAGIQTGDTGRNIISPEEQERRRTDIAFGLQSLSGSVGVEQAVAIQKSDAYGKAVREVDGSEKINKAFARAAEGGVVEKVIKYVIQTEGENTPAEMISSITKLTIAQEDIMSLPDEMIKGLKIDTTDPADLLKFGAAAKTLKDQWKIIENLNPNINMTAAMEFLTLDAEGKPLTPEQVSKNVIKLNKAMKDLESGNPEIRKRAMIDIAVAYGGNNVAGGTPQEAAANAIAGLKDQFKNFDKLDPIVREQMIEIRMAYEVKNLSLAMQLESAMTALKTAKDPESRQIILKRIASLQSQIGTAEASVKANLAPIPGSGSSSGSSGSGEKSIAQQLKEQAKLSGETFKGISNLQNQKGFKKFIAGPFAPEFLEYLRSQGAAGLKLIKGGLEKVRAAYADYQKSKISDAAAMAALTPQALVQESKKTALSSQYNKKLAKQGMYADDIDAIRQLISDEDLLYAQQLRRKLKDKGTSKKEKREINKELEAFKGAREAAERDAPIINQAQKISGSMVDMKTQTSLLVAELGFINEGKTPELATALAAAGLKAGDATGKIELFTDAYNKLKAAEYARDPGRLEQEKRDNLMEINNLNRQIEELKVIKPLEDQVKVQQKIIDAQEKIVRVKQQEIDVIGRAIELKQRELEPLDDQIESLQEISDKTSEAYDAQIEALDEIYNREENIAKLKQGQLDVAQALSRGDVAAAAQGALGMSQELARQSREEARSALESQKDFAIKNIQNQILEIEKQKKKINQDIEDLQMRQRAIQDDIYTIQSTKILPAENEIYRLQGLINVEADLLEDKYNNATTEMANLVAQLDLAIKRQLYLNSITPGANAGETETTPAEPTTPADQTAPLPPAGGGGLVPLPGGGFILPGFGITVPAPAASVQQISMGASIPSTGPSAPSATTPTADQSQRLADAARLAAAARAAAEAAAKRVAGPSAADRAADAAKAVRDAAAARAAAEAAANAAKARAAAQAKANEAEAQRAKAAAAEAADRARAAAEAAAKRVAGPSAADRAADAAAAVRAAANAAKARAANRAFGGFISNYAMGGMVNYKGSTERAPGMMYGGSAKKYAYGSTVPGRGMTDKVPALLTPGEFVVRKRVAEQYGPLLKSLNGQVFPKENFDKDNDEYARRKRDMDMMRITEKKSSSSLKDAVQNAARGGLNKILPINNQNKEDRLRSGLEPIFRILPIPRKPDASIMPMPRKPDVSIMPVPNDKDASSLKDALDKIFAINNQNKKDRARLAVEPNRFNADKLNDFRAMINQKVFPTMKTNSFNSSNKTEKSGSMYNYNVNVTLNGSDMDANDVANAVMQKIKMTENKGIRSNNIRG